MSSPDAKRGGQRIGRYVMYDEIAAGGMATVHLGRLLGPAGFARTVAVKRLHPSYARDPSFVAKFLDEARLAARIRHPNVASTLDVVAESGDLFLVLDYVHGESLARLERAIRLRGERIPLPIVSSILGGTLDGLHAAHEAKSDHGEPLAIVHRDVSPQNVIVGADGLTRVLDFGIAKAAWNGEKTRAGQLKGKLAYMAPEQITGATVDQRADVFAASVMLWQLLTGERLFGPEPDSRRLTRTAGTSLITRPSSVVPGLPAVLDEIVMRGLSPAPEGRFETARAMAIALERALPPASAREVGAWVESVAGPSLAQRSAQVGEVESRSSPARAPSHPELVPGEPDDGAPAERISQVPTAVSGVIALGAPGQPPRSVEDAPTSVSQVTDVTPPPRPPLEPVWRRLLLGLAAVAALIALGVALSSRRGEDPAPASEAPPGAASPPSVDRTAAAAGEEQRAPTASSASNEPAPEATNPVPSSATGAHTPARPKDCQVPYVIGADGIKRFKPECLVPKSRTR